MKTQQKIHENTIFMHLQQFQLFHSLMTSKAVKAMRSTDLVPPRLSLEDPIETVGISKMGVGLKTVPLMPVDKVGPPRPRGPLCRILNYSTLVFDDG